MRREWFSTGIHLGYRYEHSPIVVPDGTPEPRDDPAIYVATSRPGHRAPNVVVAEGETLFDQFGPGYTLVDAIGGPSDAKRLVDEADLVGLPIRHLTLGNPRLRQLYRHHLVLVRPDLHIAWSGTTVTNPADVIARVRGAL